MSRQGQADMRELAGRQGYLYTKGVGLSEGMQAVGMLDSDPQQIRHKITKYAGIMCPKKLFNPTR